MKIFEKIVQSTAEPSKNNLWINGNDLLFFGPNGWTGLDFSDNRELRELIEREANTREEKDQEIKDTYLPLSGGKLTGNLYLTMGTSILLPEIGSTEKYGVRIDPSGIGYSVYHNDTAVAVPAFPINNFNNWGSCVSGLNIFTESGKKIARYGIDGIQLSDKTNNDIPTANFSTVRISTINGTPIMIEDEQEFNLAPLENGLVPAAYLPSYVDDVLEYTSEDEFPAEGESGKIYVDTSSNLTYRWSGSQYIEISKSIGLGTSSADAYPGNLGKQNADNITTIQSDITSLWSGIGTNSYTGTNYLEEQTDITNALKQLDSQLKTSNDTIASNKADADSTYATKDELSDYLPLSGGTMTGGITFESELDTNEYVDLGLPSGLLWAKYNIGANSEEEAGLYFQWGDTQGYTAEQIGREEGLKEFLWSDYKFSINGSSKNFSKYNASDNKTVLDPEDDAAHVNMGGNWRMPTFEECKELFMNTDIYLVQTDGKEIHGTGSQNDDSGYVIRWDERPSVSAIFKGIKLYKKGDKQTYLFVPASGFVTIGTVSGVNNNGSLWSASLNSH